jgi:hypothetical protein
MDTETIDKFFEVWDTFKSSSKLLDR